MKPYKYLALDSDFQYVPSEVQREISRYIVSVGDLIITIVGATIGKMNIIHKSLNEANLTENCVKLIQKSGISVSYIYHYLLTQTGQNEIQKRIVGGAQGKLPIYNVESLYIIVPNSDIYDLFSDIVERVEKNASSAAYQSVKLKDLASILLTKMVKG
jgi:type I restriction enzyme, S subunit